MTTTDDAYFDLRLQVQVTHDSLKGGLAERETLYEAIKELADNPLFLDTEDAEGEPTNYSIDVWEIEPLHAGLGPAVPDRYAIRHDDDSANAKLICTECWDHEEFFNDGHLCDVEHGDSFGALVGVVIDHEKEKH